MKGKTHVTFGILLGAGVQIANQVSMVSVSSYPLYYGGVMLGSLLPDIDHPRSMLGSKIYPISVLINKTFGHRGFTHSILSFTLLGYATILFGSNYPYFSGGLLIGYLSHLLGDMFTPSGVPLLYPNKKRYSFRKSR